jgi:hypothetical protein
MHTFGFLLLPKVSTPLLEAVHVPLEALLQSVG